MLHWETFDTIRALPPGLWNSSVGYGSVSLDERLFRVSERLFPQNRFRYFLGREDGAPAALAMVFETVGERPERITGTLETSGLHWWIDENRIDKPSFARELTGLISTEGKIVVLRDFYDDGTSEEWAPVLQECGYRKEKGMDVSVLTLREGAASLEDHVAGLKYKYRYQIERYRSAIDRSRYEFTAVTDYLPLLDRLYPLYLEVCSRAEEYRARPYPEEYFRIVKEEFGEQAVMMTVRDKKKDEYLGFMLLLYSGESCVHQYIGFRRIDELFLWHNLTLESIGHAIQRGIRKIDMGVTHATAKHKFGAKSVPTYYFTR